MTKQLPSELEKMFDELCDTCQRTGKKSECVIHKIKSYIKDNFIQ